MLENNKDINEKEEGKSRKSSAQNKSNTLANCFGKVKKTPDDIIDYCKDEIDALGSALKSMGSSSSSEQEIVEHELDILKKYCIKLVAIQKENADLKKERDLLKSNLLSATDTALKEKLVKLDEITKERDSLKTINLRLEQDLFSSRSFFLGYSKDTLSVDKSICMNDGGNEVKELKRKTSATQTSGESGAQLLAKIVELEGKLMKANESLRKFATQLEDTVKFHQNKLQVVKETLSKQSQEFQQKENDSKQLISQKEQELEEKERTTKELRKELNELQQQLKIVRKRSEEAENALKKISDDNFTEINKLKAQSKVLTAEISRLNCDLENKKRECEQMIEKLIIKNKNESEDHRIKQLEQADDQLVSEERLIQENDLLRKELVKMKEQIEQHKSEIIKLETENNNLKSELLSKGDAENRNTILRQEVAELQNDIERYKKESEILKSELKKWYDGKVKKMEV